MEKKLYFLGIDIGTFSSKGVIIDGTGSVVVRAETPHNMENPAPGYYEQDAEQVWWYDFCLLSRQLIKKSGLKPEQIQAVGASTLGADCLPVDRNCSPLRKAILYGIDSRSVNEMKELTDYYGKERVKQLFGRPICSGDVAAKILWLKKNEPEIHENAYKFLTGSSYITAKLTGNYVIDNFLGIASFRPFYRKDGSVIKERCTPVCRPEQLAEGRIVTEQVGRVIEEAAKETGLAKGTMVITGTGDSSAEAISAGVLEPGDMMVQFGSSLFFYCCTDHLVTDDRVRGNNFTIPGTFSVAAGTNNGGTLQSWYRDQLFPECLEEEKQTGENAFSLMMTGLKDIEPGCMGLITLPYFAGERTPINDPAAKGIIFGLTLQHTKAHLYRSALEGIGFSVAQHMDIFKENGLRIERILAAGGGTKNSLWMQIIADITGFPIAVPQEAAGACYADALMAAIGYGHYQDFSVLKKIVKIKHIYWPDKETHKAYGEYRRIFDELYKRNCGLMHE